jgi:hypothetical protein
MNPPAPQLDQFREAVAAALRLEAQTTSATAAASKVEEIRRMIETSEDEIQLGSLVNELAQAEIAARISAIRADKLKSDLAAAWGLAGGFVRHACNEVGEAVGMACEGAWDHYREICVSLLAPETKILANEQPSVAHRINSALGGIAPASFAVGPANLHQARLQEAQRKDHYSTVKLYCQDALRITDEVLSDLENIRAQAALLAKAHAAVLKITA